jgi:hypothetical protein
MTRFCVLMILLSITLSASISAQPVVADETVAYQINPAHTGSHHTKGLHPRACRSGPKHLDVAAGRLREFPEPVRDELPSVEDLKEVVNKLRPEMETL